MAILPINNNTYTNNRTSLLAVRNPIHYDLLATLEENRDGAKQAVIYVPDFSGNFSTPINLEAPLLASIRQNYYHFRVDTILKNAGLFPQTTLPPDDYMVRNLQNFVVPYRVKTQKLNDPATIVESETYFLINAKVKRQIYQAFQQSYFEQKFGEEKYFLNNFRLKRTSKNSLEYLTFVFNIDPCPTDIRIEANVILNNDTQKVVVLETMNLLRQYQTIEINASFKKIAELAQTSDIQRYYIQIMDNNTNQAISCRQGFFVDINQDESEQQILFKNLFGAWETIRLMGDYTQTQEVQRQSFENEFYQTLDYHQESFQKIILRTGLLDQTWLQYIGDELITSKEIYWVTPTEKIRLKCQTESLPVYNANEPTETAEIEFRIAQTETY
jgi:hypothetical protein